MICVEILVYWGIGFFYLSMCSRLEIEVQIFCEVPSQREVAIPEELLVEDQRQFLTAQIL